MARILLYALFIISSCLIGIEKADGQTTTSDSLELLLEQANNDEESNVLLYDIKPDLIEQDRQDVIYTRYFVIAIFILSLLTIALAISRIFSQRKANKILSHQRNILKKTLIELRISEQKYKALFSQANDAIFLMDHKTFIDCNDKTTEMFGCIREDIIGHPPYEFSPPKQPDGRDSEEKALELINQCIAGNPQQFYWIHTKKDGTPFDAEVSLNSVDLEGSIYVQAIVRNISVRVHAEKEMVQARKKAEKATESKTFFLAKMSHEIRTMLGGITSSSQLMMDTRVNKYQSELLDIINTSADNLLEIVNEILDFSKIEAGKIEIEDRVFNIRKILEDNVNTYLPKSREKGITTYLSIHHKIPDFISGDELRLKQILSNLLSNAIKFTDKGSVTIDVAVEKEIGNELMIKFLVSDTGIGIPSGKLKEMFTEYSQSDVSISRRFGGTGLGLNIVYKLVNLMKGSVEVQSELKKGTQFALIIPFRKAIDTPSSPDDKPVPKLLSRHKYKILLAEDNVMNQKITMINLKNLGHHVDLAENGLEAWEKYQENDYDIILMDIQMPEMDGIEVTHLIRKHEKENKSVKKIRIVALTANILGQDAEYCIAEGMDAYIAKPFRVEDIIEKLEL
ncbi:MAG: response regulator [Bacteroidetes bacterium]|nr:response regulator [Bacteroidota bacterium]